MRIKLYRIKHKIREFIINWKAQNMYKIFNLLGKMGLKKNNGGDYYASHHWTDYDA
jgi:hypothetical protein